MARIQDTSPDDRQSKLREAAERGTLAFAIQKLAQTIEDQKSSTENIGQRFAEASGRRVASLTTDAVSTLSGNALLGRLTQDIFDNIESGMKNVFSFFGEKRRLAEEQKEKKEELRQRDILLAKQLNITEQEARILNMQEDRIAEERDMVREREAAFDKIESLLGVKVESMREDNGMIMVRQQNGQMSTLQKTLDKMLEIDEESLGIDKETIKDLREQNLKRLEERQEGERKAKAVPINVSEAEAEKEDKGGFFSSLLGMIPGLATISTSISAITSGGAFANFIRVMSAAMLGIKSIGKFFLKRLVPLNGAIEAVKAIFAGDDIAGVIAAFFGGIVEALTFGLFTADEAKTAIYDNVTKPIQDLVTDIFGEIDFEKIIEDVKNFFVEIGSVIDLVELKKTISDGVGDWFFALKRLFTEGLTFEGVFEYLKAYLFAGLSIAEWISDTLLKIGAKILSYFGFDDAAKFLEDTAAIDITGTIKEIVDSVTKFLKEAIDYLSNPKQIFEDIKAKVFDAFGGAKDSITEGLEKGKDSLEEAADAIKATASDLVDEAKKETEDALTRAGDGLSEAVDATSDSVKSFGERLANFFSSDEDEVKKSDDVYGKSLEVQRMNKESVTVVSTVQTDASSVTQNLSGGDNYNFTPRSGGGGASFAFAAK
jgi:uncharacterized protein YoxC